MISVGSSNAAGGDALYLREVHTRATRNERATNGDQSPRDGPTHTSLGRLLRLLADPRSDENYMEAAIVHVDGTSDRIASDGIDQQPAPKAVFSLSDHRHISNLETVLRATDRAISEQDAPTPRAAASRNLLRALASALVTQSVEECSSTKANLCVWTSQSKKRLRLLQWMLRRSSHAAGIVLQEVIGAQLSSQEPHAKTSQLTACLVVFELAQRVRRDYQRGVNGDWASLVDPLVGVITSSTVQTSSGAKSSKLGAVALDALLAVLCVAAIASSSAGKPVDTAILDGMEVALKTLIQWNARSSKRQWLLVAARCLLALTSFCKHDKSQDTEDTIVWHWNASALWLCSRSDVVLAAKKQLTVATKLTIQDVYTGLSPSEVGRSVKMKAAYSTVAGLIRLCILHGLHSADEIRNAVFTDFELTGKLLISLAAALTMSVSRDLAVDMLRLYLIGKSLEDVHQGDSLLHLPMSEIRAFISLTVKLNIETTSNVVTGFVAELCLASGVSIMRQLHASAGAAGVLFWLSTLDEALKQYVVAFAEDPPLRTRWLRDATLTVLQLVQDPDKNVRTSALRMLSKLDLEVAMEAVASTLLWELDPTTSGGLVTLLFLYGENSAEPRTSELASMLMETLCIGPTATQQPIDQPSDFSHDAVSDSQAEEKRQELVMALSTQSWCRQATTPTREAVLSLLVRKVFASPRDSWPLSWLRELSLLGWFDPGLDAILPIITTHMQGLEQLTEALLEDNSAQASKTVEQLLFARLAPNLVLRVIPRSVFLSLYDRMPSKLLDTTTDAMTTATKSGDEACLRDLALLLWSQAIDPLEFKDVKMLAIELLTKLPAHEILPHVLAQLHAFLSEQSSPFGVLKTLLSDKLFYPPLASGGGFVTAKLMMYYLNRLFTDDTSGGSSGLADEMTWGILFTVLSLPCHQEESFSAHRSPLVDLQMGAIECLALLVSKSLRQKRRAAESPRRSIGDLLVELIASGPQLTDSMEENAALSKWRAAVHEVNETQDNFSASQLQICCCNVLLSTLSKIDDATLPAFQERVVRHGILSAVSHQKLQRPALAGCLQVVFSYIFRAGATLESTDPVSAEIIAHSVSAVVGILHSSVEVGDQVYMSTLKLLGALIGKVSWLWPSLSSSTSGTQQDLADGLQKLRDTPHSVSPPVRQLAQSLLQAILPA